MLSRRTLSAIVGMLGLSPLFATADFCAGQYEPTAQLVNEAFRKYETLYSGGDHAHSLDDVGATLDLYRLWRGLPDVQFRAPRERDYDYFSRENPADHLEQRLALVETADAGGSDAAQERSDVAIELDLATRLASPRDEWTRSPEYPLFDWLNMVMVASDAPWTISSHMDTVSDARYPAYERLRTEALQKFDASSGLEWAVAAQLTTPPSVHVEALDNQFAVWQQKVMRCEATAGEYAAWASAASVRLLLPDATALALINTPAELNALPGIVKSIVITGVAAAATADPQRYPIDVLSQVMNTITDPGFAGWIGSGSTYRSASIEDLVRAHDGKAIGTYTIRALNVLSVEDLGTFWRSTKLPDDVHAAVLGAIFARNLALGRYDAAYALLGNLKQTFPEHSQRVSEIDALWIPLDVKLALIALDNPQLSTWITINDDQRYEDFALWIRKTHRSRDLPVELSSGVAIQQDYETWLFLPERWTRYQGMHGSISSVLDRINASDGFRHAPESLGRTYELIPAGNPATGTPTGLGKLVAWDELEHFTPGEGFTHVVSQIIVTWAREESSSWIKRVTGHRAQAAQALSQVVELNRLNDGGTLQNVPAGQAAFKLLKLRFKDTAAAQQTPYWFISSCESGVGYDGGCW